MKSRPIGAGQQILASHHDDQRDDARGGSFLLAHQQLGALALPTNPSNGNTLTVTINGTGIPITFVLSIGSTANNVLIGPSAAATVQNLVNFFRRPDITNTTQVAASSPNQSLLQYAGYAWPGSSTNIVPFSLNKNVNDISAPLTSFTASTAISGASWTAQTMQLYIEDGTYYINGARYLFTGSSTPTVAAPVSHPRIDVLTIDATGTLAWTTGSESVTPSAPTYPANKVPICELYNVVSETGLYDTENQQSNQGYIYNDVRPHLNYGTNFGALPDDIIPDTTNTRSLGNGSSEWLNVYAENIYVSTILQLNGLPVASAKFGGTGADGALTVSSGTTTINLGGTSVFVKNYSSISITGTGNFAFSNPATNGTIIIFKCTGNVTITSSATAAIDMTSATGVYTGSAGGAGGTTSGGGSTSGGGQGGGGASAVAPGTNGTDQNISSSANGSPGSAFGSWGFTTITGGQGGVSNTSGTVSGGTITPALNSTAAKYYKVYLIPGSGGGGGGTGNNAAQTAGTGGRGGAAFWLEVAGALNLTGTINASGQPGQTGGSNCTNGSGGGGGAVVILYYSLTANTGTITVSGGGVGSGSFPGVTGANGFSVVTQNTEFS